MLADQETGPSTGSTKRKAADMGPSDFGTRPAKSLSVIVPTCNNANVVARTLRSVEDAVAFLRGRPKYADFGSEVVVVDDGSQDGTRQAVEEWTRGKSLYKVVLRSESSSPSCSRNTGAACSTGDLLFFLDGDDVFLERHLFDCVDAFDRDGDWARQGQTGAALLAAWLEDPYFSLPAPKSTGRDHFNLEWLQAALHRAAPPPRPQDVQATLLELTASTIAQACRQAAVQRVFICGGGAHNGRLMGRLRQLLAPILVESTAALGIDPLAVEACAFAWLAARRHARLPGNLPSVTGARGERILGVLAEPPPGAQ